MKFQKGLLNDSEDNARKSEVPIRLSKADDTALRPVVESATATPQLVAPILVDKNRLFETIAETRGSSKKYLAVLGVVVILVIAAGVGGSYYMAPGIGDKILAPKGLEVAIRENFLTKLKRDSTDISYYKCEGLSGLESVWKRETICQIRSLRSERTLRKLPQTATCGISPQFRSHRQHWMSLASEHDLRC